MNVYYIVYSIILLLAIIAGLRGIRNAIFWHTEILVTNNKALQEIRNELQKKK